MEASGLGALMTGVVRLRAPAVASGEPPAGWLTGVPAAELSGLESPPRR